MLILTRRMGESIVIEGGIKITALAMKGNQVRLGIVAPPEISVHREEIQQKIDAGEDRDGNKKENNNE